jgi:hypothetical protein
MQRCWRRGALFPLVLAVASIGFPRFAKADVLAVPEVSFYLTHNNIFRSRLATGLTWSKDADEFSTAAFEYDLDVGLGSFFRRYVFKDPNAEKSKRVSLRLGYAYIPDLNGGDDEKRVISEATFRFPMGPAWLLSDRNRFEFRAINGDDSTRYRNRLRIERGLKVGKFRATPYSNAEVYFDSREDEWNRIDGTVGAEFPWRYKTVLEFYLTWQYQRHTNDSQTIGLTLQKYL